MYFLGGRASQEAARFMLKKILAGFVGLFLVLVLGLFVWARSILTTDAVLDHARLADRADPRSAGHGRRRGRVHLSTHHGDADRCRDRPGIRDHDRIWRSVPASARFFASHRTCHVRVTAPAYPATPSVEDQFRTAPSDDPPRSRSSRSTNRAQRGRDRQRRTHAARRDRSGAPRPWCDRAQGVARRRWRDAHGDRARSRT